MPGSDFFSIKDIILDIRDLWDFPLQNSEEFLKVK